MGEGDKDQMVMLGGIVHLCLNPAMYQHTDTFAELIAFIEGFDLGRGASIGLGNQFRVMTRFGEWLSRRCGTTENYAWEDVLLLYCSGDAVRARKEFTAIFTEFMAVVPREWLQEVA